MNSYLEYLSTCTNKKEIYTFDTQDEADGFGRRLRKNLMKEIGCGEFELSNFLEIKISNMTVRIKAIIDVENLATI